MKLPLTLVLAAAFALACSPESQPAKPMTPVTPATKPSDPDKPSTTVTTPTVTAEAATEISLSTATIGGSYKNAPEGGVYEMGVDYGVSSSSQPLRETIDGSTATSGSFTVNLSALEPNTTYYYKTYVTVWNTEENRYVDYFSSLRSFKTEAYTQGGNSIQDYLHCYEIPKIDLKNGIGDWISGQETPAQNQSRTQYIGENTDNVWFKSFTTKDNQVVVTHTFKNNGNRIRNWTGLIDKDKQGPLWIAFIMHGQIFPRNSIGRYDKYGAGWTQDPAVPSDWQRTVATSNYSRGHFVASDYRQNTVDANSETFYYTNQALQWQDGFNSGIWSSLESNVSSHSPSGNDTLYVVVGVLYKNANNYQTPNGGGAQVLAPSHFYKCLMKCSFDGSGSMTAAKGVAYLFENKSYSGAYGAYATTIDEVEAESGFDFFANVPQNLQDAAEKQSAAIW